jgi:hypothetical protein
MDFFDRLKENGSFLTSILIYITTYLGITDIVRHDDSIVKCFDEYYDQLVISDELRKVLVLEESDNFPLYTQEDRNEFIFHLFRLLCLGGSLCQYEDELTPYLTVTKALYKTFVR